MVKDFPAFIKFASEHVKPVLKFMPIFLIVFVGLTKFMPEHYAILLSIDKIRTNYAGEIGLLFLASLIALALQGIYPVCLWIKQRVASEGKKERIINYLSTLSPNEKRVLSEFTNNNSRTMGFKFNDVTIVGLENHQILYLASTVITLSEASYGIHTWVFDYLQNNLDLLKE